MAEYQTNLQMNFRAALGFYFMRPRSSATLPKGGVRRLTLGTEDKQVRDWFCAACRAAGFLVHIDAFGSIFAVRPGHDPFKAANRHRLAFGHATHWRQI